jgi:hypothetical protein
MPAQRFMPVGSVMLVACWLFAESHVVLGQDRIVVSAAQLIEEFDKDEKTANQKYQGAMLEVAGKVLRVDKSSTGQPFVEVRAGKKLLGLKCYTIAKEPWGTFGPGQEVKVAGKWPPAPVVAELRDCTVEAVGQSPLRSVAAQELAGECAADLAGSHKKYSGTMLLVSGTVADRGYPKKAGTFLVYLQTEGDMRVSCRFPGSEKKFVLRLKAGQPLTVAGRFNHADAKEVVLDACLPLTVSPKR